MRPAAACLPVLLFILGAFLSVGCATVPNPGSPQGGIIPHATQRPVPQPATPTTRPSSISASELGIYRTPAEMKAPPSDDELAIVASAKTLIGKPPEATVIVNGKQFVLDCIGTVAAIYYGMDIDITKDFDRYEGSGVDRLYMSLKNRHVLHKDKLPRPGDVVVWDNTWDANGNGNKNDDPRTHAGLVLAVDEDGTIHYVHENYRRGVIVEVMNLLKPDVYQDDAGKTLNSPLAMAPPPGAARAEHWVAGDLFDTFGDVLKLKGYFHVVKVRSPRQAANRSLALSAPRP